MNEKEFELLRQLPPDGKTMYLKQWKNPWTAFWANLFLGGLGVQFFYLGSWILGLVCLLFCWTFLPLFFSIIFIPIIVPLVKMGNNRLAEKIRRIYCDPISSIQPDRERQPVPPVLPKKEA